MQLGRVLAFVRFQHARLPIRSSDVTSLCEERCCAEKLLVEESGDAEMRNQALRLSCLPSFSILNGALVHFISHPSPRKIRFIEERKMKHKSRGE